MLYSLIRQYFCKNTKNIQKSDYMDGFCLQGELDLTLFYKIEGYFDNLKSLMTGNRPYTFIYFSDETPSLS